MITQSYSDVGTPTHTAPSGQGHIAGKTYLLCTFSTRHANQIQSGVPSTVPQA